jgi:hypothetical protein
MPAWYNRRLVERMKGCRISVSPSAELEPMENEEPLSPGNNALPVIGRQMSKAESCSV